MSDDRPAVVGVGNILMGDDGVGPQVIELLRMRGIGERAELLDAGLAFGEVLCDIAPERTLVIVDATRGGDASGTIYRLDPSDVDVQAGALGGRSGLSLHEVNVLPTLQTEALAGRAFKDVTIFGIEPEVVDWSEALSPAVADAAEKLVDLIVAFLDERARKVATKE